MQYEWDENKNRINLRKHGLKLSDGIGAFEDPNMLQWIDDRHDYGEQRIVTLGRREEDTLVVITTEVFQDVTRIISVRRANSHEEKFYYEGFTPVW